MTDSGDQITRRGRLGRREGRGDLRRRHENRLHKKGGAGQGGRGSSMESTEGPRASRSALTSDGAARVGRRWGTVGDQSRAVIQQSFH